MGSTKEELREMIKKDNLTPILGKTYEEAKNIVKIMMSDILKSHKENLRKGA